MISSDKNIQVFFALVRAGLWADRDEFHVSAFKFQSTVDWEKVYQLAEEQSVQGLVLQGIDRFKIQTPSFKIPQEQLLQWIGEVQMMEQQNKAMNAFVARLIEKLRTEDVYALLVKGQGIAQCYERPLWRTCGDVDLLLSEDNYKKAKRVLSAYADSIDDENKRNCHIAMTIKEWTVELHGTLRSGLWKRIDRELDLVQRAVFWEGKVRSWLNGTTQVFLPHPDEDVIFVFSHILQHFYKEGVGLRQICDWCRLLWIYRDSLNHGLLESRIRKMGIMSEWKAFGSFAVDYLGMPRKVIPFYSTQKKWSEKAKRILSFIIETGSFGQNRDYSYYQKYPYVIYKAISLWKHLCDSMRYFLIFPNSSFKVLFRSLIVGFSVALRGDIHE